MLTFWVRCLVVVCLLSGLVPLRAQETKQADYGRFTRRNTWTLFLEGSPTSSHILMGQSRNRIFATAGGSYARRLLQSPNTAFSYVAEVRPAVFLADPVVLETTVVTGILGPQAGQTFITYNNFAAVKCSRRSTSGTSGFQGGPYGPGGEIAFTVVDRCGWQWTYGQTYVPVGFKYSWRTHKRLQPYVVGFLGYMYMSRPVPVSDASPLNYVFGVGTGLELYRTGTRSVSMEARWQHFSNKDTAEANPGVDSVMYRMSYSFGH